MGWKARCQAGSSLSPTLKYAEEPDNGSSSQLEITIISGQYIQKEKYVAQMLAYAVAWIREDYKLKTHVVDCDNLHPCWNARLHFMVSDAVLNQEKGIQSALTVELYCQGRLRDTLLGTARVLLSTLSKRGNGYQGAQCLALQIRRPSGRTQGILNIGSIIFDLDSACGNVPPLLTNPHSLCDEKHKVVKRPPLREFQEICRRSFSVSRDDVLAREKIPHFKFALDDNSLQHPSFSLMEAVAEDENKDDEEELAMEVIYRRLKALTKGGSVSDDVDAGGPKAVQMSKKRVESVEDADSKIGGKALCTGFLDEPSGTGNNDDQLQSDRISSKETSPELLSSAQLNESIKLAIESLEKHAGKQFDKFDHLNQTTLNHEAKCKERSVYPMIYQDGTLAAKKQDGSCDDGAVEVSKMGESVVLVWKDLPLHKKKQLFCDEIIARDSTHCKSSRLRAIWGRRASWSLWKGAAKIHLSPG